jgi:hypothetical protein
MAFRRRRLGVRPFTVINNTSTATAPGPSSASGLPVSYSPEALLEQFRAQTTNGSSTQRMPPPLTQRMPPPSTQRMPPPSMQRANSYHSSQQPMAAAGAGNALLDQVQTLQTKVDTFDKYHIELSHIVYTYLGTAMCDVPYYDKLPTTKQALGAPSGVISAGTVVTLGFPHTSTEHFGWMRHRRVHPNLANVNSYFVPLLPNTRLTPQELEQLGLDPSITQYFNYFHNAGETNPAEEAYAD